MIKKFILFLLFSLFIILIFSQDIPHPKHDQLYTEFISYRNAAYLKKPLISKGYIAMDGTNKFVFKQINPVKIEIKKVDKRITYKKGNAEPLTIDGLSDDIFFLFNYDSDNLGAKYNITRKYINNKEVYNIIPKEKKKHKTYNTNCI